MKKKIKESEVQRVLLDYLKAKRIFHYRNNSGAMAGNYKGKKCFMRFGAMGSPDIVSVIKGQYVGIEVKGTGGKQSDHQKEFQENLERAGGKYLLVYSLEDFITKYQQS